MAFSTTILMAGTLVLVALVVGSSSGAPNLDEPNYSRLELDERIRLHYEERTTTEPPVVIGYPRVMGPDRRERSNKINVSAISLYN